MENFGGGLISGWPEWEMNRTGDMGGGARLRLVLRKGAREEAQLYPTLPGAA